MDCVECREALSARLDGELGEVERDAVEAHLQACAGCAAHAEELAGLTRWVRLQPAEPVPDLGPQILARLRPRRPRPEAQGWLRLALLAVAGVELALALPDLAGVGGGLHEVRELASWHVALAAGLALAAWRPVWVGGLLPLVGVAATVTLAVAALDVWAGHISPLDEAPHLVKPVGLVLLWRLARAHPGAARPGAARPGSARPGMAS